MLESLMEAVVDSLKLLPFLFLTYLVMEALEHRAGAHAKHLVENAGRLGPLWGGVLGVVPQCGFSAAASSLFAGRVIGLGTLLAIYLSTSDEMLPIFISEKVALGTILKILGAKALIGMVTGFLIELVRKFALGTPTEEMNIHEVCEHEHCKCEDGILKSALKHTITVFGFLLLISLGINLLIGWVGTDKLAGIFSGLPVVGEMIAGLVGLIPNCAASVIITELYLQQIIAPGAMMAGLLTSAGVGVLVLFRMNRHWKENLKIVGLLYGAGVCWGLLIEFLGIVF